MDQSPSNPDVAAALKKAFSSARCPVFLLEPEVYSLLSDLGLPVTPYKALFQPEGDNFEGAPPHLEGPELFLKVVSPYILHKSDVGGLRVVENNLQSLKRAAADLLREAPLAQAKLFQAQPVQARPQALRCAETVEDLHECIRKAPLGVMVCQKARFNSGFGHEMLISLNRTREFGPVVTAGLGGVTTELLGRSLKPGLAVVSAAALFSSPRDFLALFKETLAYQILRGQVRGGQASTTDSELLALFETFWRLAECPPSEEGALYELEINPLVFTDGRPLPLDGLARFGPAKELPAAETQPLSALENMIFPKSVALTGVSARNLNFGRIVLRNLLRDGYPAENIRLIKPGAQPVDGVAAYERVADLPEPVDLLVILVPAPQTPPLLAEIIATRKARAVVLMPGAMGETEASRERGREVADLLQTRPRLDHERSPICLGGNCLGLISRPGRIDTVFITEPKMARPSGPPRGRLAMVSQSGAFIVTRQSRLCQLDPRYMVSLGNQTDLTLADLTLYFAERSDVDVIMIYAEGFRDYGGLALARAVRRAVAAGQDVIFYKAGRTPEGQDISAGHTASLAGDHQIATAVLKSAGALVAPDLESLLQLTSVAVYGHGKKVGGRRLGGLSTAGFEAVGIADELTGLDFTMEAAELGPNTQARLRQIFEDGGLGSLVSVRNPLDTNPGCDDKVFYQAARAMVEDPAVDAMVMGLMPQAPAQNTLPAHLGLPGQDYKAPDSIVAMMLSLIKSSEKPIILALDGGQQHDEVINHVERETGVVFRSVATATQTIGRYLNYRLRVASLREAGEGKE